MSTLVPIKMLVSSLTELHTPRQTLSFNIVSYCYWTEPCFPAHIDCYYCNSQYGLEHRVQSSNLLKQSRWYKFFPLYLWAKYELIWTNFTAQTVISSANMLVQAQTIPQNAKCWFFFFYPKLRLLKTLKFGRGLRFLRCG